MAMVCMIWRATCGSGVAIGTGLIITSSYRPKASLGTRGARTARSTRKLLDERNACNAAGPFFAQTNIAPDIWSVLAAKANSAPAAIMSASAASATPKPALQPETDQNVGDLLAAGTRRGVPVRGVPPFGTPTFALL